MRRVLRIEPGVSLGWWAIERTYQVAINWAALAALASGAVMSVAAYFSGYSWADLVFWALVIAIAAAVATNRMMLWSARRGVARAELRYVESHLDRANVNPLDETFTKVRIDLRDLLTPLSQTIKDKSFVKCQIVGPLNLVVYGTTTITFPNGPKGGNCEAVYCGNGTLANNAINIVDCDFRDCEFFNVTFMVYPHQYEHFTASIAVRWISENPQGLKEQGQLAHNGGT